MFGEVSVCDCLDIVKGRIIRERIRMRGNTPEMFFLLSDEERVLPVYRGGTAVIPWGARRGSRALPATPWVRQEDIDAGRLAALEPEQVVIRASRTVDNGIWFDVSHWVLAILVRDDSDRLGAQHAT
jgi:hypothetical protein